MKKNNWNSPATLLKDEALSQKLLKKWFWLYFFWYLMAPLGYLVRLFISNSPNVSVADFWVMYSIISLITFLYTYNDLWLTESLQYFLPRFYIKKEYNNIKTVVRVSLATQIFTWIFISIFLRFWSERLAIHYFQSENAALILKYFCIYFIGNNIFQVLQTTFNAFQKTFEYEFVDFIRWWAIFFFTVFCFFTGRGTIEWYSLNWVIWIAAGIIVALILYKKYRKELMKWNFTRDTPMLKTYTKYALWAFIWTSISTLFWQIIQQMVLFFLGPSDAWYYSNFLSLFYIWTLLLWPIMYLIFPIVSELIEKKNNEKLSLLYSFFYNYFSIAILSFSTILIVLGPEIATALFWKSYMTSWELLIFSWGFLIFSLLSTFNYSVLAWMWKVKERVYITWIAAILTVITTYIGIKLWNINGAGIAFWLSNFYTWFLSLYLLKKENFSLTFNQSFILKNCFLFLTLWLLLHFTKWTIFNIDWNRRYMILTLIWVSLAFYICIWIFNIGTLKKLGSEIKNLKG